MTDVSREDLAVSWLLGSIRGRDELVALLREGLLSDEVRSALANALHGRNGPRLEVVRARGRPRRAPPSGDDVADFLSGATIETQVAPAFGRYILRDAFRSGGTLPPDWLGQLADVIGLRRMEVVRRYSTRGQPKRPIRHDLEAAFSVHSGVSAGTDTVKVAGRHLTIATFKRRRRLLRN